MNYTKKQMGDACEMLVAAELTLAGNPALKASDYWPGCDLVAQPPGQAMQRVSVKSRTFKRGAAFVGYDQNDSFDWLAIVILPANGEARRRIFLLPRDVADKNASKYAPTSKSANVREWRIDRVAENLRSFENNFSLNKRPDLSPQVVNTAQTPASVPNP